MTTWVAWAKRPANGAKECPTCAGDGHKDMADHRFFPGFHAHDGTVCIHELDNIEGHECGEEPCKTCEGRGWVPA